MGTRLVILFLPNTKSHTYYRLVFKLWAGHKIRRRYAIANIADMLYISVGIAMSYGMDGRSSIPGGARDFSVIHRVRTDSGAHPASWE
jgi:hypothetical protein